MLKTYHKLQPMPKTTDDLKVVLQTTCEELSQEHINKALANFTLIAYMAVATRGRQYNSINLQSLHPHLITNKPALTFHNR